MNINTSLEILCAPIVAHKNLEGKNPEIHTFNFLWWRHYGVKFLKLFWSVYFHQVFGHILQKFGVHYTFWWKIVVPQSENFSFFPFTFLIFYKSQFLKTADVSIFFFSDWFFHFSILHYISFSLARKIALVNNPLMSNF